ncbi:hypothetical protein Dimus_030406 [Dionaea muscipula]
MMKRATMEDGQFRVRVECRRSCRLSPSLPSIPPDLDGLSPIAEGVESIGVIQPSEAASVGDPVRQTVVVVDGDLTDGREGEKGLGSAVVADSTSNFIVSQAMVEGCCQREGIADSPSDVDDSLAMVEGSCRRNGVADGSEHDEHGLPCPVADEASPPSLVAGGLVPTSSVTLCPSHADQAGSPSHFPFRSAAAVSFDGGVVPETSHAGDDRPEAVESSCDGCVVAGVIIGGGMLIGILHTRDDGALQNGVVMNGVRNGTSAFSKPGAVSHLCRLSDDVSLYGGGMVSEEGRALPVARGALRSQPIDGLRQPFSSPVEPVSIMASGVCQDGRSGGGSYAHVIQVDRRADVELSYLPPVGGGNTITMEESDGDNMQ